ncbi:sigma-54 dependent transcriptional regulator [Marinobacter fonticola]|uniref:sigma-54 dependent transcriptional regulator n=1 Tax=Marinobacter fonticola TaxID=2603215 RepID=UPI0011E79513|nr:sigma-54 dependent transcriptional regulator [Marinobacter fonticola]
MLSNKNLIWLAPGNELIAPGNELSSNWTLTPIDIAYPPRRRRPAFPLTRVGLIDLTGFNADHCQYLEAWIEQLRPTHWVGLLDTQPDQAGPLSDIVTDFCSDYHTHPYDLRRLDHCLGHLWGMANLRLRRGYVGNNAFKHQALNGASPAIRQARELLRRYAHTLEPVLITGESGTGKNAAARFLHDYSNVRQGPYIAVNCAALPPTLTQSELFGHEKGAFTHALSARTGRIEQANGGSLVFRDIDELQPAQQSVLLRFLQEGQIERLGGHRPRNVQVRVIATSSRPLEKLVSTGEFRADMFYRLGGLQVRLPPLRERLEDIPLLAEAILGSPGGPILQQGKRLGEEALRSLLLHYWPGNLRELENRLHRAMLLGESIVITPHDLELKPPAAISGALPHLTLARVRARAEREAITHCLNLSNQNISAAARLLRISRLSLYRLMKKHGAKPVYPTPSTRALKRKGGLS